jgi:ribosomal protein L11 methyltransferase
MPFLTLSFELGGLAAERALDACTAAGALAVTLSDAGDEPVLEPEPGEVRLWNATRVQALFAAHADRNALEAALLRELALAPAALSFAVLPDRAWEREWLQDFHARRFGQRLWICPWHEQVEEDGAIVVRLDPGLAFGTGTHPSTALCLQWLDAHLAPGSTVIDYGCGSGILGLAAARLGARRITAFDIDPQALLATAENAAANGVEAQLQLCSDAALLPPGTDLLLANIIATTLCALAAELAALVRPGGALLLAGILADQAEVVAAVYAPWFDIGPYEARGDWVALAGTRKT